MKHSEQAYLRSFLKKLFSNTCISYTEKAEIGFFFFSKIVIL